MDANTLAAWTLFFSAVTTIVATIAGTLLQLMKWRMDRMEKDVKVVKANVGEMKDKVETVAVDVLRVEVATNSHATELNEAIKNASFAEGRETGRAEGGKEPAEKKPGPETT